jgi:diacylglycerol diphosphate phosphatase/phosphatidate phosphatase
MPDRSILNNCVADVLCGSLLGISISYLCYRQYYPSLMSIHSHRPYAAITPHMEQLEAVHSSQSSIQNEEQIKWI